MKIFQTTFLIFYSSLFYCVDIFLKSKSVFPTKKRLKIVSCLVILSFAQAVNSLELERWVYLFEGKEYKTLLEAETALRNSDYKYRNHQLVKTQKHVNKNIIRIYDQPTVQAVRVGELEYGKEDKWGSSWAEYIKMRDGEPECPDSFEVIERISDKPTQGCGGYPCDEVDSNNYFSHTWKFLRITNNYNDADTNPGCFTAFEYTSDHYERAQFQCPENFHLLQKGATLTNAYCQEFNGNLEKIITSKRTQYCTPTEGNPCSPITGQKTESLVDYASGELNFSRHYFSINESPNLGYYTQPYIGQGWTHNYAARLRDKRYLITEKGNMIFISDDNKSIDSNVFIKIDVIGKNYYARKSNGSSLRFNASRKNVNGEMLLDAIIDVSGRETKVEYEQHAWQYYRIKKVIGPSGHQLSFEYDGQGRIEKLISPAGEFVVYVYDRADSTMVTTSRLVKVVYPDETDIEYHYEDTNYPYALTGISHSGIRYGTYAYDTKGRVIESGHADGYDKIKITYNDETSVVTYADNSTKTYNISKGLEGSQDKAAQIFQGKSSTAFKWEGANVNMARRLLEKNMPSGEKIEYQYTGNHLTKKTQKFTSYIIAENSNPENLELVNKTFITDYEYLSDDEHLPTKITSTSVSDNTTHKKTESISYHTDFKKPVRAAMDGFTFDGVPVSHQTTFQYNDKGQLKLIDGRREDVNDYQTYEYYDCYHGGECGQLKKATNALNQIVTYDTYNAHGRVTQMTDSNGLIIQFEYRSRDNQITQIKLRDGNRTRVSKFSYYDNGLIQSVTSPSGASNTYFYNAAKKLIKMTDRNGNSKVLDYDLKGNLTKVSLKNSNDQLKYVNSSQYNEFNQLVESINGNQIKSEFGYDEAGNIELSTNGLLNSTSFKYDQLNRLSKRVDALGYATYQEHNAQNLLKKLRDAEGKDTLYDYDDLGNLLKITSPDTGITRFTYDKAGNVLTKRDARGVTVTFTYDALNRIKSQSYSDSSENIIYIYDDTSNGNKGVGRLTRIIDESGITDYIYNGFGDIIKETQTINGKAYVMKYNYGNSGLMAGSIYPSGHYFDYWYNNVDKVEEIYHLAPGDDALYPLVTNIHYLPFGPMESLTYGNRQKLSRTYDLDYRLTDQITTGIQQKKYIYDLTDNVKKVIYPLNHLLDESYDYDKLSRLVVAKGTYDDLVFSYDKIANRQSKTSGVNVGQYVYADNSHHLTAITGHGAKEFTYDDVGNTLTVGDLTLTYNHQGRLKSASKVGMSATYHYSARGERRIKRVNGVETHFVYNYLGQLIAEANNEGISKEYIYLHGQPLAQIMNQQVYYYHNSHLGTPEVMTDYGQNTVWQASYSPFGKATVTTNIIENNLRFPGQYFDSETELHYNYFRYYDSEIGRYITSDPIGLNGGVNTYGYVGGNSVNYVDPDGKIRRRLFHMWARLWKEPHMVLREIGREMFPPPVIPVTPNESGNVPLEAELPPGWPNQLSEGSDDNVIPFPGGKTADDLDECEENDDPCEEWLDQLTAMSLAIKLGANIDDLTKQSFNNSVKKFKAYCPHLANQISEL
ncbi:RHS repeat-associated core domain-containing protein [Aliikangiella sp. IMCC44359]|uniref:RHS repeat-associated core domain-containing protein n=1 Tax=Aliikangiella sp. IMCC44359 TaxID=3459125 RepID=UPI00403AFD43